MLGVEWMVAPKILTADVGFVKTKSLIAVAFWVSDKVNPKNCNSV